MQHKFNDDYSSRRVFNIYFSTNHIISNTFFFGDNHKNIRTSEAFPIREKSKKKSVRFQVARVAASICSSAQAGDTKRPVTA